MGERMPYWQEEGKGRRRRCSILLVCVSILAWERERDGDHKYAFIQGVQVTFLKCLSVGKKVTLNLLSLSIILFLWMEWHLDRNTLPSHFLLLLLLTRRTHSPSSSSSGEVERAPLFSFFAHTHTRTDIWRMCAFGLMARPGLPAGPCHRHSGHEWLHFGLVAHEIC